MKREKVVLMKGNFYAKKQYNLTTTEEHDWF